MTAVPNGMALRMNGDIINSNIMENSIIVNNIILMTMLAHYHYLGILSTEGVTQSIL